jgi:hypothetical protein
MPARRAIIALICVLVLAYPAVASAQGDENKAQPAFQGRARTEEGLEVSWGLATTLLTLRSARDPDAPGRDRANGMTVEPFPGQFGLLVHVEPSGSPFEIGDFQIVSVSLLLAAHVSATDAAQSSLLLGAGISFFGSVVGLAFTFDLYRGVPIRGVDDAGMPISGGDTAYTGLLSWAFSNQGEVTEENFGLVLLVDLASLTSLLNLGGGST